MTTTKTNSALQQVVNQAAIRHAEAQFRVARLFTPFNFEPERVDFDRVQPFLADLSVPFPSPTANLQVALDRVADQLNEQNAILQAFAAQDVAPTLTADQLFQTAQANVTSPSMARYAA